jgi:hypothetical protein
MDKIKTLFPTSGLQKEKGCTEDMLSFLRENVHPISYCATLAFYARNMDTEWSNEVWRGVSNRSIHHFTLECGSELIVLPCFGYIHMGDELLATFSQSIRTTLSSERGPSSVDNGAAEVTTAWQLLMKNHQGQFDLKLNKKMGENMYALQRKTQPAQAVWLERISFIHDVQHGFKRVQRFLARRAILRKIKARHFTKLTAFVRMITVSDNKHWRAIQDTGILSEHIVFTYLGLASSLESNRVLKLRGEKLIKTKCSMQFG